MGELGELLGLGIGLVVLDKVLEKNKPAKQQPKPKPAKMKSIFE